jgi:DNA-binding phage protein
MGKTKTLKRSKGPSRKSKKVILYPHNPRDSESIDINLLKSIFVEAIFEDDIEMLKDVLFALIRKNKKSEIVRKSKLGRQTIYDLINDKREFNPTIKTLSSLIKAIAA